MTVPIQHIITKDVLTITKKNQLFTPTVISVVTPLLLQCDVINLPRDKVTPYCDII